jgi:hypothetical protein
VTACSEAWPVTRIGGDNLVTDLDILDRLT